MSILERINRVLNEFFLDRLPFLGKANLEKKRGVISELFDKRFLYFYFW